MRKQWLNIVIYLTNRVYRGKQSVITKTGAAAIAEVFSLILFEIALAIISLPLYVGVKSDTMSAFLAEKGVYEKINFDYAIRRVLTLTGLGIFFFIWALKLGIILAVPVIYGPLQLYHVSELQPVDIVDKALIETETAIQTAGIQESMQRSVLKEVRKTKEGNYIFSGTGKSLATVVLLLSDQQTAIYYGDIDKNGNWQIEHLQKDFALREGNHSVLVFSWDKKNATRSEISDVQFFKVRTNWYDSVVRNVDVLANWSVVIVVMTGMFLTILTI